MTDVARRHRTGGVLGQIGRSTVAVAAVLAGLVATPQPAQAAGSLAARLRTLPASTRQVIIVHASRFRTSTARLEAYAKIGGTWRASLPAMTARIGSAGFSDRKYEGDRATPTGMYPIGATMYGIAPRPRVHYPYHRLVPGDWWNENPASRGYNTFVHGPDPGGPSEPLWRIWPQYSYFALIKYNVPARYARGSGIFLHETGRRGGATAGCVALRRPDLLRVLTWLNPAAAPRIVLAPDGALRRY